MPRPTKCRKVCRLPSNREFGPAGCRRDIASDKGTASDKGSASDNDSATIIMTVDEYETIRLIDKEGFSQEECGQYMQVARTTIQQIYNRARAKVADALVEGRTLRIEGGDYVTCSGEEKHCHCGGCAKHRCPRQAE